MRVATSAGRTSTTKPNETADAIGPALSRLLIDAMNFVAPQKVADLAMSWLDPGANAKRDAGARAIGLASSLALFTPSATGSTAFDRLARARPPGSPAEAAALAALREARVRVMRIQAVEAGVVTLIDCASGQAARLRDDRIGEPAVGRHFIAFMATLPSGMQTIVAGSVSLDPTAFVIVRRFLQPGQARLLQPLKCAAAVFAHVVRHGGSLVAGIDPSFPGAEEQIEPDELDMIAIAWSMAGRTRTAEDIQFVREQSNRDAILAVLADAADTREAGPEPLAAAYDAILLIQLETVRRRAQIGCGALTLEAIEAAMEATIRAGTMPRGARPVFHAVRQRLGAACGATAAQVEQERLISRIQALRAKTVEHGCTEQEAMAAAAKVAELLDRYGLKLGETELRQQSCSSAVVDTDRKRTAPIDRCIPAIAAFFDCRVWSEAGADKRLRYLFFGLPADVEAARYLYDLVAAAFQTETVRFHRDAIYQGLPANDRRKATESFQVGLSRGIEAKLAAIRTERDTARRSGSGRDLVLVKQEILEEEFERLGLSFRRRQARRRTVLPSAFEAGREAGLAFEYTPGIGHQG